MTTVSVVGTVYAAVWPRASVRALSKFKKFTFLNILTESRIHINLPVAQWYEEGDKLGAALLEVVAVALL